MRPPSLSSSLVILLICHVAVAAASSGAADNVNLGGYWMSFTLLVILSAVESALSFFWVRYQIVGDTTHPYELSMRICGRQIMLTTITEEEAADVAANGLAVGCGGSSSSSLAFARNDRVYRGSETRRGCSTCGGFEKMQDQTFSGSREVVIDKFGSIGLVPTLFIRRFDPRMGACKRRQVLSITRGTSSSTPTGT